MDRLNDRLRIAPAIPSDLMRSVRAFAVVLGLGGFVAMASWSQVTPALADDEIDAAAMHAELLDEDLFPSASKCKSCHEDIYREWASSNHA